MVPQFSQTVSGFSKKKVVYYYRITQTVICLHHIWADFRPDLLLKGIL